jgi:hypothetical protein
MLAPSPFPSPTLCGLSQKWYLDQLIDHGPQPSWDILGDWRLLLLNVFSFMPLFERPLESWQDFCVRLSKSGYFLNVSLCAHLSLSPP